MDDDRSVTPEQAIELAAAKALNDQVLPQLAHLAHGPLAFGTLRALQAAAAHKQPATIPVLHVRVSLEGQLYEIGVHVQVNPQP